MLTSPSPHFGGWSGLVVDAEGKKFFSISDVGSWMSGEIAYNGDRPVGLEGVRLGPIRAKSGEVLTRKRNSDAEGLTLVSGTPEQGTVLISFGRKHRIGRFDIGKNGLSPALGFVELPPGAKKMTANKGLEAVAILRAGPDKGSLVAFAENLADAAGDHPLAKGQRQAGRDPSDQPRRLRWRRRGRAGRRRSAGARASLSD